MSRREEREQVFALLFERLVNQNSVEEVMENAGLARDCQVTEFMKTVAYGVESHEAEIDGIIEDNLTGRWKRSRLSKVTMALLQLAIFEMKYLPDIPLKVSINESVELAKLYGGSDDAAFLNGVLGGVVKGLENANA
ncbi:MAG: transcription antitermination factor NusB [Oscillospiraceae bacterium]|nr:transcription antitermination factor NusB [Oscillospiraceae bacterium]